MLSKDERAALVCKALLNGGRVFSRETERHDDEVVASGLSKHTQNDLIADVRLSSCNANASGTQYTLSETQLCCRQRYKHVTEMYNPVMIMPLLAIVVHLQTGAPRSGPRASTTTAWPSPDRPSTCSTPIPGQPASSSSSTRTGSLRSASRQSSRPGPQHTRGSPSCSQWWTQRKIGNNKNHVVILP